MRVVRDLEYNTWQDFVNKNPGGNIFHTPEMFQIFAKTRGYQPNLWAVTDQHNYPLALFIPVTITLMSGKLSYFTSRAVAHGGVLCKPDAEGRQALMLLLQTYTRAVNGNILFTELRNLSDTSNLHSVLIKNGFTYEEHLNYLINLNRPACDVLQDIGSRTRKKIRRGLRKKEVEITQVTTRSELKLWYDILQKTYRYARVPLSDCSLFEAVLDNLTPKSMAHLLLAQVNGEPAACSLELCYKDTIYGWYGGTDRAYSKFYPNELLNWHILEWGTTHGYKVYDFGGAGKPDEEYGVRNFKAKFGGELIELGRYTCVHSPARLMLSKFAYSLYQRIQ